MELVEEFRLKSKKYDNLWKLAKEGYELKEIVDPFMYLRGKGNILLVFDRTFAKEIFDGQKNIILKKEKTQNLAFHLNNEGSNLHCIIRIGQSSIRDTETIAAMAKEGNYDLVIEVRGSKEGTYNPITLCTRNEQLIDSNDYKIDLIRDSFKRISPDIPIKEMNNTYNDQSASYLINEAGILCVEMYIEESYRTPYKDEKFNPGRVYNILKIIQGFKLLDLRILFESQKERGILHEPSGI